MSSILPALQAWANQHVGPATVALYLPLQPLASSLFGNIALGAPVFAGSVGGGAFILCGAGFVLRLKPCPSCP